MLQSNFRTFVSPPKKIILVVIPNHHLLSTRQSQPSFFLYRFTYYGSLYINGILQYVVFCDWLISLSTFSRFVYLYCSMCQYFIFISEWYPVICTYHILFLHSSVNGYLGLSLWPLWITLLWASVFLCGCMFSFIFGENAGSYYNSMFDNLTATLFYKVKHFPSNCKYFYNLVHLVNAPFTKTWWILHCTILYQIDNIQSPISPHTFQLCFFVLIIIIRMVVKLCTILVLICII